MDIMTEVVTILTSGITQLGITIGSSLSTLASNLFMEGDNLSTFGVMVVTFAGISLAFGLTRWVLNFVTSLGSKNN